MSGLSFCQFSGTPKKGKYAVHETEDIRAPLQKGWKRETTVREYTKSGIRGEVVYVGPCGKKFKQYPDIIRVGSSLQYLLYTTIQNVARVRTRVAEAFVN